MDRMKWFIAALSTIALLLSSYAVYMTRRMEAASKPRIQLIELRIMGEHYPLTAAARQRHRTAVGAVTSY